MVAQGVIVGYNFRGFFSEPGFLLKDFYYD